MVVFDATTRCRERIEHLLRTLDDAGDPYMDTSMPDPRLTE